MSAHRLAYALENPKRWIELSDEECDQAAAELRRLAALNAQMLDALRRSLKLLEYAGCAASDEAAEARAAIAAGEQK
jgi:hypothetical protein